MQSYRDVAHDTLSAFNRQGNVEWALFFCGFIIDALSESILTKLDYTIWVTKLLYLEDKIILGVSSRSE